MGPQQLLHRLEHRLQLLLLPYLGLGHLGHVQLAVCQFFCNKKDEGKRQSVRKSWRGSGPPGQPAALRSPHPLWGCKVEPIITNSGDRQEAEPQNSELSSHSSSLENHSRGLPWWRSG